MINFFFRPEHEYRDHFHVRAAKLINVYLKAFLFSEINSLTRPVVHPPVDSELLVGVRRAIVEMPEHERNYCQQVLQAILQPLKPPNNNWFRLGNPVRTFTHMTSGEYEAIINAFYELTNGQGLWKIEKFWYLN
ncbi:MAG: hypothetical protein OXE56_09290 [Gammaproteobacteria bacterium]|nr:hypothetical protein [Gammaproteobacteria bacterium]